MRYSVHTTEIHLDRCNDEKIFSVIKFMENTPDTNTMNKKIKFLAKGAKFQAQAQKTSKEDFIWRICLLFFESPGNFPGPNANFKIKTCRIVA